MGLEVARRRGRRTLVLVPNGAVQAQWLAQWEAFAPPHARPHPVPAGTAVAQSPLTVVPYAELAVRHPPAEHDESAAPAGQGDLLVQLDPAVREVLERAGRGAPWLLVLDECGPSELRGAVASGVREALGRGTEVVGLGSVLPADLPAGRRELTAALLGDVDLHVPLAAAVQDGDVAPYQELLLHCAPTPAEQAWLDAEVARTSALVDALLAGRRGSRPLLDWLSRRLLVRPSVPWTAVERSEPELARAGLRLASAGALPLPRGAWLREEHRVPLDAADWAAVLEGYAADHLAPSRAPDDAALLDEVLAALPSLGRGPDGRRTVPPVDRLCALTPAKVAAAERVLAAEAAVLGGDLRALVVCDTEDEPPSLSSPRSARTTGSALLAVELLAAGELAGLSPVLVTNRRVAATPDVAQELRRFCGRRGAAGLRSVPLSGTGLYVLASDRPGWGPRAWTPHVTAFLDQGRTRLLVGTPALLGEGWDCPSLSVVVDLCSEPAIAGRTGGRALRVDPERPGKTADLWSVVCVADGHPAGTADHLRAVARHTRSLAPGPSGEVLAGLGHCDPALRASTPLPPPERAAVDERALQRAGRRDRARDAWRVGATPRGGETVALLVRTERDLGLAGRLVPSSSLRPRAVLAGADPPVPLSGTAAALPPRAQDPSPAPVWPAPVLTAALAGGAGAAADPLVGVGTGAVTGAAVGALLGGLRARRQLRALRGDQEPRALEQLAAAVADALHAVGDAPRGSDAVVVQPDPDGGTRCRLGQVPSGVAAAYADALEELLLPVAEPRWLVARPVVARPADERAARRLALSRAAGRPVDALLTWHAVPAACSSAPDRVDAFAAAWEEHVGPVRLVRCRDREGRALLDLLRGADPFGTSVRRLHTWQPV